MRPTVGTLFVGLLLPLWGLRAQSALERKVHFGKATWYGQALQGHYTASGERFDCNALTAAHKWLPLGTFVKVTNERNKKSVILKINDRVPASSSPVIDVTRRAAEILGFRKAGVALVKIEVLPPVYPLLLSLGRF
ncbi:MAG: septal ring lytic transglycosylase RlpA family protein [Flavobacteriales bacterium]|nr:septal ring lytic transglycosylase RlpA family protein [Flavobacteriales bacterium]MCX7767566.1 septal ring lytic transglycosylase RlpA family protein [Flavobacteriales bacterium]MDW8410075.1 septal ring lytic transglycosylase RlpA family protein [Flavobacteriales bacterium]